MKSHMDQMDNVRERGADCLGLILNHYGINPSPEMLRSQLVGVGSLPRAIMRMARKQGLRASMFKVRNLEGLRHLQIPVIIEWIGSGFVVVEDRDNMGFTILDPMVGRRYLDDAAFASLFTGLVITFTPEHAVEQQEFRGTVWQRLRGMLTRTRRVA